MRIDHRQVCSRVCRLVLLTAMSMTCAHAEPADGKQPAPPATKPEERKTPADTSRPAPAPSPTFTPSEEIEADSAVSFPVDI